MVRINTRKEPDGWRSYLQDGDKIIVVDGFFDYEEDAVRAAVIASQKLRSKI